MMMNNIRTLIESRFFQQAIILLIVLNALAIGFESSPSLSEWHHALHGFDHLCIVIFTVEIGLKLLCYRRHFFTKGWNLFDLIIISISWVPTDGFFSVFRVLRIFRAMRLFVAVPAMRRVIIALGYSINGLIAALFVLLVIFYIFSVMGTQFFGSAFYDWFGTVPRSMYTLFQIMTLESWSMGIVRPIMHVYPFAWAFFIPFIIITAFILLNFLIGIVVDAITSIRQQDEQEQTPSGQSLQEQLNHISEQIEGIAEKIKR